MENPKIKFKMLVYKYFNVITEFKEIEFDANNKAGAVKSLKNVENGLNYVSNELERKQKMFKFCGLGKAAALFEDIIQLVSIIVNIAKKSANEDMLLDKETLSKMKQLSLSVQELESELTKLIK